MRSWFIVLSLLVSGCASSPRAPDSDRATRIVHEELERVFAEWQPRAAVIVVLDAHDGRIVAAEGRDASGRVPDLAATRTWITGSTLKSLTVAAAIEQGKVTPDTMLDCAPRTYPEGTLTDWKTFGSLSVRDGLAVSSNVCASRVLDALGLSPLLATFGRLHVLDAPGSVPATGGDASLKSALLAAGELAETSPLRLAAAYAALFDEGRYHAPTPDGRGVSEVALTPETAATMITLLENTVVGKLGTGHGARIEGHRVAGKTGTAELPDGRAYASFVGAIVDVEPRLVVLVGLDAPREGASGGTAAAPAFARVAERLMR